jgi:hypothetical protein
MRLFGLAVLAAVAAAGLGLADLLIAWASWFC